MKRHYYFDNEQGTAYCFITDGNKTYTGLAQCHEEDRPFMSERTGLQIAECRAEIAALKNIRDNELLPAYKALQHLQTNIETSKYYSPKAYETRMLRRQVCIKQNELAAIKQEIATLEQFLNDYIEAKNKLYHQLSQDKKD